MSAHTLAGKLFFIQGLTIIAQAVLGIIMFLSALPEFCDYRCGPLLSTGMNNSQSIINQRKVDLELLSKMEQQKLHLPSHLTQKKILD